MFLLSVGPVIGAWLVLLCLACHEELGGSGVRSTPDRASPRCSEAEEAECPLQGAWLETGRLRSSRLRPAAGEFPAPSRARTSFSKKLKKGGAVQSPGLGLAPKARRLGASLEEDLEAGCTLAPLRPACFLGRHAVRTSPLPGSREMGLCLRLRKQSSPPCPSGVPGPGLPFPQPLSSLHETFQPHPRNWLQMWGRKRIGIAVTIAPSVFGFACVCVFLGHARGAQRRGVRLY